MSFLSPGVFRSFILSLCPPKDLMAPEITDSQRAPGPGHWSPDHQRSSAAYSGTRNDVQQFVARDQPLTRYMSNKEEAERSTISSGQKSICRSG